MKIDYSKLFILRPDGRYQGKWHELVDGKPVGQRHTICDRDPERLYRRILEKETPAAETFGIVAQEWWEAHAEKLSRGTQTTYRSPFDNAIKEFGNRPLYSITPADINAELLRLKVEEKSYKYAATVRSIYKQIFDYAIATRRLKENPVTAIYVPRGMRRGRRTSPEKDIIDRVKNNFDKPFGEFAALLYYTGIRTEEAAALTWGDIGENSIRINKAMDLHGTPKLKSTKTSAGERELPILIPLRKYLVKPDEAEQTDYLFSENGKPYTRSQITSRWLNWCKQSGLAEQKVFSNRHRGERECSRTEWRPMVTPHQLRHHFATVLFEAGFDELATQNIMGHEDIETTRRIYTTLRKDYLQEQYKKLDELF